MWDFNVSERRERSSAPCFLCEVNLGKCLMSNKGDESLSALFAH
ncbi:hypothetical protein HMPREF9056_01179 [Actinomyces sp. oral taxon 170 str. F0386]|nr:hypothetical protein HMPREF9056_01179 [Actinomyces sp. oral taxon 170 str. F0386]